MTKKQTPHVVVSAVWVKNLKTGFTDPVKKQCHFVMAVNDDKACDKVKALLPEGRKIWLARSATDQDSDPIQKKINKCFADNGVILGL